MTVLKKLDIVWLHSDCSQRFKLQVLNAVIRQKLLYGLESAHLSDTTLARIDVFHRRGLRKNLGMTTTFGHTKRTR